MSLFDEVLNITVRVVEASPIAHALTSVTVIRDLRGRVRLVLDFKEGAPRNWKSVRSALAQQLSLGLGPYWGGQIWHTGGRTDPVYQAMEDAIRSGRQSWYDAPTHLGGALQWYRLERIFSKSSWIGRTVRPPWTLDDPANPPIISFYSFKGGVGRTTAVAAVALLLARARRRVVVLDLDLEAPGVGTLLLGSITPPEDGIVDYLLEMELLGQRPANLGLYAAVQNQAQLIGDGEPIRVFTAGRLSNAFLEKIARLDFESFVGGSLNPLAELLDHIRQEYRPEYTLLDVRAGLHDLGGLSLNGMSHLDVLFGLDTPQSWKGLEIVLPILGMAEERREAFLVHAMVTPERFDPDANTRFREHSLGLFQQYYYRADEDIPDTADPDAPYGLPIPYQDELLNVGNLAQVMDLLMRPDGPYAHLVRLIGAYVQRETL